MSGGTQEAKMADFSKKTLRSLSRKGIAIVGITLIPDMSSALPFANGDRGYQINDNGCGRVWSFSQVLEAAR